MESRFETCCAESDKVFERLWLPSAGLPSPDKLTWCVSSDAHSPNSAQSMAWKIKRHSNDELRQRFIDQTIPQLQILGCTAPDPDLKFNEETGHWEYGEIDWTEFFEVLKGNGPCNKERVAQRKKAIDEGAWVREAAVAYANKKQQRNAA